MNYHKSQTIGTYIYKTWLEISKEDPIHDQEGTLKIKSKRTEESQQNNKNKTKQKL